MKTCLFLITGAFHTDGGIAAVNRLSIHAALDEGFMLNVLALIEHEDTFDPRYGNPSQIIYRVFHGNKLLFTLAIWQALSQHSYDYVFVDHVNLASVLAPFSWIRRCRYLVWFYGVEVFPPKPDFEGRLGMKNAWKRLAISGYTRDCIMKRFPHLAVTVCDLALDPVRHILASPDPRDNQTTLLMKNVLGDEQVLGEQVILHVGRMASGERYKGQDSLLQAFPLILRQYPQAQLILAGRGDDMPRLFLLARALPASVQDRVFMPGYVPDDLLDQIYRSCYIFAMPSVGEGFGLVYLEAMSRAKPCLGGRVDATPWIVRDGITGLLVDDPRSSDQVAEKILWFFSHPQEARQMGKAGFDLVQSYYLFAHFKERFWKAVFD